MVANSAMNSAPVSPANPPLIRKAVKIRRPVGMPASSAASGFEPIAYRSRAERNDRIA